MGTTYQVSDQQWTAISAPLEPAVVIAGAGSGKTSVMAARVVYLVATGQVQADQVLGLTFTTKATAELASRVREALVAAGLDEGVSGPTAAGADSRDDELPERVEPMVVTYNAYAAALLVRARPAHRPRARHQGDGRRLPLPGGRPRDRAPHGCGQPAQRAPEDRHRLPARARCRAERAPGHGRRGARVPCARPAGVRGGPGDVEGQGRHHRRRWRRWPSARRCSSWSRAIARSRRSSA